MNQPRPGRTGAWIAATVRCNNALSHTIPCAVLSLAMLVACSAQAVSLRATQDSLVGASLANIVSHGDLPGLRRTDLRDVRADVSRLYAGGSPSPIWSTNGGPTPSAHAAIASLTRTAERGLDPTDYDVGRLAQLALSPLADSDARAEFDMALSVATLRALRALYYGRVNPTDVHSTLRIARDSLDFVAVVTHVAAAGASDSTFDAAEPQSAEYQNLRRALAVYRSQSAVDDLQTQARLAQIELTMERWRWLPRTFDVPPVIVNIPAYHLSVLSNDSATAPLSMDVVVGTANRHETPIFTDTIRFVEFAPYWIVPLSIAKAELIQLAMSDPHILTVNNYEIVNSRGTVLVPSLPALRRVLAGTAFIRQLPGGSNSLGRVKFLFPNVHDVYLHDSPLRSDFERRRRDRSHGCIRIADARGLAVRLLREQPEWTVARIDRAMNARTPTRVALSRGVPVYLFYATAVAAADGGVEFHADVYGLDAALAAQLARGQLSQSVIGDAGAPAPRTP